MNEIRMDNQFQSLFPTVSRDEYIELSKEIVEHNFKNKDEIYKYIIIKQIEKKDLSLYIKCLYALKFKEIIEKYENQFTKNYSLSNTSLSRMTGLSRDAIDKIIVIEKEATLEQHNRLFNEKASLNKIFYELKPGLAKAQKIKEPITEKKCNECGIIKPISKFYKGRGICKVCYNDKDYSSYKITDIKGNKIIPSEDINELTKKYSEKIENDLYDVNKHIEYKIEDMEEEINGIIDYFERNVKNCIKTHSNLLNDKDNENIIRNILSKVESNITILKGMLSHEQN